VPGAVSAPAETWADDRGRLLDPGALRARVSAFKRPVGAPVGVYCGSGVTASYVVLALAEAGVEAALYAGSWSDWVADPSRPVARGDAG
jgi:thiosulfate/3-mercaptopyruvate sulfurtransferase